MHFNRDELEARYEELKYDWEMKKDAWEKRIDELKKEVLDYVNSQVNRFSRLSEVVEEKEEFEMTPTKKDQAFPLQQAAREGCCPQGTEQDGTGIG